MASAYGFLLIVIGVLVSFSNINAAAVYTVGAFLMFAIDELKESIEKNKS